MSICQPALGLVCLTVSDRVRYRTITRTRLLALPEAGRRAALRDLYAENLRRLDGALDFCAEQDIRLYRIPSDLLPFSDDPAGAPIVDEMEPVLRAIGGRAAALGIRLVLHPDQFVVLNSDTPSVIDNSVTILAAQARLLDALGLPRTPWATLEIHGGKSGRAERLIETVRGLPDPIRLRLALENDERAYGAGEILDICRAAGVPMVFDAHHHAVHEGLDSYEGPDIAALVAAARATWPVPEWQLVHISNGREFFADRRHSDLIAVMPSSYAGVDWIEVEAKSKEQAIAALRAADWPRTRRTGL